jgi:KDO2-lipid IV(A) lauroyltransferase
MNPIREKTEYLLTRGFFAVLKCCPAPIIYGSCRAVADLFYLIGTGRRRITIKNLRIAFPEKPEEERKRIALAAYRHFGRMIAESSMVLAGKLTREKLMEMVDGHEMPRLLELEKTTDKGVLVITGHLGNFELLAHYTGMQAERQGYVVARRGTNQLIDDRIVTPMRESFGNQVIYKNRALPRVAKALKTGGHAGLLIDIKTNAREGVPVEFFGEETLGLKSSAYLQIKLDPMVIPMTLAATQGGRYELIVSDPIEWKDNGKPMDEQIAELAQLHHSALEKLIRKFPEQWLWMHNRWKNR